MLISNVQARQQPNLVLSNNNVLLLFLAILEEALSGYAG
jgi:hypothetical protein